MTKSSYAALFLCTGNSARSILAEAILNRVGVGRFRAYSAGSFPKREVHPMALEVLREHGHDVSGLRSKSWDEFSEPSAPSLDFIFTVCDNAAGETCPVWPGQPVTARWGIADPAAFEGPLDEQREHFDRTYDTLERMIRRFTELPIEALDPNSLKARLEEIAGAETAAATAEETR